MIDGYSLFRKREAPRTYTFTVQGDQPNENAEEYRIPAMAIAAARRAKNANSQPAPSTTPAYQFKTNSNGQFYSRVNEWPFELPGSHRSIANAPTKDIRIVQVAGGQWAATVWDGNRFSAPILYNKWTNDFKTAWMNWLTSNGINPRTGRKNQ